MSTDDDLIAAKDDALQRYFAARGLPAEARQRGLRGLVNAWASVARAAARYDLTLDDWRNDLDLRDIIAGAMMVPAADVQRGQRDAIERADELFRAGTIDIGRALWGRSSEPAVNGESTSSWWYHRRPKHPGAAMRADLEAAGFATGE